MAQKYSGRAAVAQQIDLRKLPAGHMRFSGGNDKGGLYISGGHPYDLQGNLLPADIKYLRDHNFIVNDAIKEALAAHLLQAPVEQKQCIQCSADIIQNARFCSTCGAPQGKLWAPGDPDPEADSLLKLVDPEDPFGTLTALDKASEPPVRKMTPEEHFAALNNGEEASVGREMKVARGLDKMGGEGSGEAKFSDDAFGTLEMAKGKKKK